MRNAKLIRGLDHIGRRYHFAAVSRLFASAIHEPHHMDAVHVFFGFHAAP
jgi:hypothetical protein